MNAYEKGLFPEMQLISFLKLYPGGILPHDDLLLYVHMMRTCMMNMITVSLTL